MMKVMLDSGAFSAWKRGVTIPVEAYAAFIHANREHVTTPVNLDVIPTRPSLAEECAKQGWANWLKLRSLGVEAMPVYHAGERQYWLEKMVGEGASYVGLGGVAKAPRGIRKRWIEGAFSYLCGLKRPPKVHGFGITTSLVNEFPWTTVDSTAWMQTAGRGRILYEKNEVCVTISHPRFGTNDGPLLSRRHLEGLERYLASLGSSMEAVRKDYRERARANVRYFQKLAKSAMVPIRTGLFSDPLPARRVETRVLLSLTNDPDYWRIVHKAGESEVLFTYYWFVENPKLSLAWLCAGAPKMRVRV